MMSCHDIMYILMISCKMSYMMYHIMGCIWLQVRFVNAAIDAARPGSALCGLEYIEDPSDKIIEVHLASLRWDHEQRRFGLTGAGLEKVHELSIDLLDTLEEHMPERTGGVYNIVLYTRYVIS